MNFLYNFTLTLMLTQAKIFDERGSLSAAAVAKIGTHSESGAIHNRHPPRWSARRSNSSDIFLLYAVAICGGFWMFFFGYTHNHQHTIKKKQNTHNVDVHINYIIFCMHFIF